MVLHSADGQVYWESKQRLFKGKEFNHLTRIHLNKPLVEMVIKGLMSSLWIWLFRYTFHVLFRMKVRLAHLMCFQPPRSQCFRGAAHQPPPWTDPVSLYHPGQSSSLPHTCGWSHHGHPAVGPSEGLTSCAEEPGQSSDGYWRLTAASSFQEF